jgi:tRNA modification GTPase
VTNLPQARPDLIAAIATAPGRGGVGVVRVSGAEIAPLAVAILGRVPEPRRATFTHFLEDGEVLDEGIALYCRAFVHRRTCSTGHGGWFDLILQRCVELVRLAVPGEFTRLSQ